MRRIPAEPLTPFAPAALRLALGGVLLAGGSVAAARLGWLTPLGGLGVLAAAVVAAGLAVLCVIAALAAIWRHGGPGLGTAIKALLLGMIVLAPPAYFGTLAVVLPPLHDVTTDLGDAPSFGRSRAAIDSRQGRIPPEYSGLTAAEQRTAYPAIRSIVLDQTPEEAFALALRTATDLGWTIIDSTPPSARTGNGRIEATARTFIYRFTDDVTVRIRPGVNETRIDVRSASREPLHDLGRNSARTAAFQREIELLGAQR